MIAKHIAMSAARKSSFVKLVHYLTDSQGKEVRTSAARITNCMNDSAEVAALEVLHTQTMNTRSMANKTYHLMISFRRDESPDAATLAAVENCLCDGLGFSGHQRVSVVHDDTNNLHLHVAINKIHPKRYTIHEPFHAYRILARLCENLEAEYNLQKDNHTPQKKPLASNVDTAELYARYRLVEPRRQIDVAETQGRTLGPARALRPARNRRDFNGQPAAVEQRVDLVAWFGAPDLQFSKRQYPLWHDGLLLRACTRR